MCSTVLEEKTLNVFNIIYSEKGISFEGLVDSLNSNEHKDFSFNSHVSLYDLLKTNILIGRLREENNTIYITPKGKKFLEGLMAHQ